MRGVLTAPARAPFTPSTGAGTLPGRPADLDASEGSAGDDMFVGEHFGGGEHGCDAQARGVTFSRQLFPGAGGKSLGEPSHDLVAFGRAEHRLLPCRTGPLRR